METRHARHSICWSINQCLPLYAPWMGKMEKGPSLKEVSVLPGWRCDSETIELEGTRGSTWQEVFKWHSPPARPCRNTPRGQCFQWLWEMWELQRYRALTLDRQPCHVTCSMAICHCMATCHCMTTGRAGGAAWLISQMGVGPSWEAEWGKFPKSPCVGHIQCWSRSLSEAE